MTTEAERDEGGPVAGGVGVDWSMAATTAALLVGGGPAVPRDVADQAVADLTAMAGPAEGHVREATGLGSDLPLTSATVVDRRGWVRSAAASLDTLTTRATAPYKRDKPGPLTPFLAGSAGVQTGLALAFLGTKVLGQYDPFWGDGQGRLLLVAPNIVQAERAMDVDSGDFRLWVCLHEGTHRLQFTAVGWLADYFADEVGRFVAGVDEATSRPVSEVVDAIREGGRSQGMLGIVEALQTPRQREAFDRLLAMSTLLEGHADYVMDAVGPEVVPSVATIRKRFTQRRRGGSLLDRVLRGLLGIDAKIKQYEQGAAFTKHVVGAVGMTGFNAVWRSPNTLPTRAEIMDPDAWLRRINPS